MTARTLTHPAVVLGGRQPRLDPASALVERVRMVLETRPGLSPWRPDFGCDLAGLTGQPATAATLQMARSRVEAALRRWVPDAAIVRCDVRIVTELGAAAGSAGPEIPLAEAALLRLGASTWLEVRVELRAALGTVTVETALRPPERRS